jgi:hypothetical protein
MGQPWPYTDHKQLPSAYSLSHKSTFLETYFASSVAVEGSATLASLKIKARHFLHGTQVAPSMPIGVRVAAFAAWSL